jgi:hypothetical protein
MRFLDEPIAFFLAACRADDAAAFDLGDLAPDTTTVSPALTWPISVIPKYAVRPLRPNKLNARLGGKPGGSLWIPKKLFPSVAA